MDTFKLNERISVYRKNKGLTQEQLAQALGVTNQSVSKWESGQCCPDISLLPQLANIFGILIDELFGMKVSNTAVDVEIPFADDEVYRVVLTKGSRIVSVEEDLNKHICLRFPENCNETTRQYFKVEVFGNLHCDASINGDVISHGEIECHDINGDIHGCRGDVSCDGDICGDIYGCAGNISCGGDWCGDRYGD